MKKKAKIEIIYSDIVTIEALHDALLDRSIFNLDDKAMKRSRDLTQRMYAALGHNVDTDRFYKTQKNIKK